MNTCSYIVDQSSEKPVTTKNTGFTGHFYRFYRFCRFLQVLQDLQVFTGLQVMWHACMCILQYIYHLGSGGVSCDSGLSLVLLRFIDRNRQRAKIAKIRMRFKNRKSHITSCVYKALRCNASTRRRRRRPRQAAAAAAARMSGLQGKQI